VHVSEAILSPPVLIAGALVAAGGTAIGLRQMSDKDMVKVAVISSALFVATLIKIPFVATSVHLILNGLGGILLGWQLFPAFVIALVLQSIIFGIGGLSTLGVNAVILALPGVCCYYLFNSFARNADLNKMFPIGFAAGSMAILIGSLLLSGTLLSTGEEFTVLAGTVLVAHIPVLVVEGLVTGAALSFLRKVRPETLTLSLHLEESSS